MPPKRKRTVSAASKVSATNSSAATRRPISRDVSSQDMAESSPQSTKGHMTMNPPHKRTRATSSVTANGKKPEKESDAMSIVTGGHVEMPLNGTEEGSGEHGEAGTMRFEPPPKAGLVDPAGGYKTNKPPKGRPVRIYADGVFDLFHLGHMRVLQQAKTAFPNTHLIVGVTGDAETHKRKGLTVMSGKERADSVRHCRWVDEVIEDCPWVIDTTFLDKHKIDFVAHDDLPYGASEGDDIYKPIKEQGRFLVTQRTEGVSTTGIITKIVRDYEQYITRQLKRGTSRQELNLSWLKKNEMDIKRHVTELRDTIRTNWTTTGQELGKDLRQLWQPSRPSSPAPASSATSPTFQNAGGSLLTPNRRPTTDRLRAASSSTSVRSTSTPQTQKSRNNMDFAAGYAMGLIGGVKGWMEGSKRRNLSESDERPHSPEDSPDEERTPVVEDVGEEEGRGRASQRVRS